MPTDYVEPPPPSSSATTIKGSSSNTAGSATGPIAADRLLILVRKQLTVVEEALAEERKRHQETKHELDRVMSRVLRLEGEKTRTKKHRILLVDDHHELREMYAEYLEFAGYEVAQAVNGHHAFDVAIRRVPSLIIMDLAMPQLDGWAATKLLREDDRTANVPIIALTGFTGEEHLDAAREAGCTLVLTKPCLPDQLRCIIAEKLLLEPVPDSGLRKDGTKA